MPTNKKTDLQWIRNVTTDQIPREAFARSRNGGALNKDE